jgi:glycosyltransferase involved in cell wall biosynthesis
MKVIHLSTNDLQGGAARAAFRIHTALGAYEDSSMIVNNKHSEDNRVFGASRANGNLMMKVRGKLDYAPARLVSKDPKLMFSNGLLSSTRQLELLNSLKPDIVNLHWINNGFVSINAIRKFSFPVVWTVHDMWPFTGGCHYALSCSNYKSKCGLCPQLKSQRSYDLSTYIFNKKKKLTSKITFIAPSLWLKKCIEESALFRNNSVFNIPYPIDLNVYKPRDKKFLRDLLGLPQDRPLILFGADNAVDDPRKGFTFLHQALGILAERKADFGAELVVFGSSKPDNTRALKFKSHFLGRLSDELMLAAVYGACDLFVAPSIQDNLPNTVIESLASGSPVVAFNIGGMPDMIDHRKSGYLAEPLSAENLADGIAYVLEKGSNEFAAECRSKAERMFNADDIAKKYSEVYRSLITS